MRKPRFYLDESVGRWVGDVLAYSYNVETAEQARLLGHEDSDHFAYCWRHQRLLITHDLDFLDDQNLPDTRNPGRSYERRNHQRGLNLAIVTQEAFHPLADKRCSRHRVAMA